MEKFKVTATIVSTSTITKIVEAIDMKEATKQVLSISSIGDWTDESELKTKTISV